MADITVRVAGTHSLSNADFKRLDLGTFPKDLKLTLDADSAPDGYEPFPNNPIAMIVDGSEKNVKAWRKR